MKPSCSKSSIKTIINSIPDLLNTQGEQKPNSEAILSPGRTPLTYRRLWEQIKQIVAILNYMGVGRNDRVAILLPNGPEMAVAFLGVASCATAAPLNPAYSAEELDFYLSDLKAKALMVKIGMDSPARTVAQARGIPIIELSPSLDSESGAFMLAGGRDQNPFECNLFT